MTINKHIVLVAVGSFGDVTPLIALGLGLKAQGHKVSVAAMAEYGNLVQNYQLDFRSLGQLPQKFVKGKKQNSKASALNFQGYWQRILFWAMYGRVFSSTMTEFEKVCQGADLVIYTRLAFPVVHLAQAMGIPSVAAFPVPHTSTKVFPDPLIASKGINLAAWRHKLTYFIENGAMGWLTKSYINHWRTSRLALKKLPFFSSAAMTPELPKDNLILYAYDEALLARPSDWPEHVKVTGHWHLSKKAHWQPSTELTAFLAAGTKPFYLGFGSMDARNNEKIAKMAVAAVSQLGRRAVLQPSWRQFLPDIDQENFYFLEPYVPYDWLFPHMCAVVHHGGIGTSSMALREQVPVQIIPFAYDQTFWGAQFYQQGIAPEPIANQKVTIKRLQQGLEQLLYNQKLKNKVQAVSVEMQGKNGVEQAIKLLEPFLDNTVR